VRLLRLGAASCSSPPARNQKMGHSSASSSASLLALAGEYNSCLNASFVNAVVSCDDVYSCLAASHQAVSTQLRNCFYKA